MTAIATPSGWALSVEALTSRLSPTGLKWSSGGAALVLHLGLGAAVLFLMQSAPSTEPLLNRTLNIALFAPAEIETPVEPLLETVLETPPAVEPDAQERVEPAPAEPVAETQAAPSASVASASESAPAPPPAPTQVLTAEGGEAGWAPDAGLQVSQRTAGALRGLLCAGGSEHTRAAAGCDPAAQTDPNGYAAFASADEIAKVESAFGPIETLGYAGGSTVNLGSFALPGQVNNNQPHYVSGVHSVFGQLPVSQKARDPGFGD